MQIIPAQEFMIKAAMTVAHIIYVQQGFKNERHCQVVYTKKFRYHLVVIPFPASAGRATLAAATGWNR